jgi:hypothetical protein
VADPMELHNAISPIITKLELLSRLSPMLDSDKEYAQCLVTIIDMMGDYIGQLRRTLDAYKDAKRAYEG